MRKTVNKQISVIKEHYDSLDDFARTIMSRKLNRVFVRETLASERRGDEHWSGTKSLKEALDLMKKGWDEPLKGLKKADVGNVESNMAIPKSRPRIGVVGFAPCVPNAIMGLPNSMIALERIPMKSKVLTIKYCIHVNAGHSAYEMIEAGKVMLRIINSLERKGYRVRLDVEFMSGSDHGENEIVNVSVNVKDWREQLDLKKLTFPLVNPAALRRIGFKWLETVPGLKSDDFSFGYSRPLANKKYDELMKFYKDHELLADNEYYVNVELIEECDGDAEKVMKRSGIAKGV